jgi:hypothetical protein
VNGYHHKKPRFKILAGFSVAILFGILFFGLTPKDFSFSNKANWLTDKSGIRFSKYGIAYTHPSVSLSAEKLSESNGFTIEISLKPKSFHEEGFNFLFAIHAGNDRDQLLVGQYRSWVVIMNGDDYDHKRKTKRAAVNIASQNPQKTFLTITSGMEGSKVYVDGQLVHTQKDLILKLPKGDKPRFLFGNSVYGRHSWMGDVYGFAFYGKILNTQDIMIHFNKWSKDQNFLFAKKDKPYILYLFDEKSEVRAFDHGGGNNDLKVSSRMHILEKQILSPPWIGFELNKSSIQDILLNLVGFIPLGFILAATLSQNNVVFKQHAVLMTVVFCFIVSLTIEVLQAWMPSRSSQMMDLMLNTVGALIGAMVCRFLSLADKVKT